MGQAHLVIRGRVTEVYVGEEWIIANDEPPVPLAYARIAIDEILNGEPVSRSEGSVEVQLTFVSDAWVPPDAARLPAHESVFFLMHEARDRQQRGAEPRRSEVAPFAYFVPTPQAVLRNIGGQVAVVQRPFLEAHYGPTGFPLRLQGADFAELNQYLRGLRAPVREN